MPALPKGQVAKTRAQIARDSREAKKAAGFKPYHIWIHQPTYESGYYAALAGKLLELPRTHSASYAFGYERGLKVEVPDDDEE